MIDGEIMSAVTTDTEDCAIYANGHYCGLEKDHGGDHECLDCEKRFEVEWAVFCQRNGELWRGPMSREASHEWLEEWFADGARPESMYIAKRSVLRGEWEMDEEAPYG